MKEQFNKNTLLSELFDNKNLAKVLAKHKFPCVSCPFAKMEMENLTLGQVCNMYGIDEKKLLEDLNKAGD